MSKLNFIIDAQYKAGRVFGKAKRAIDGLDSSAKRSTSPSGGMGKMASLLSGGLVAAAGAAVAAIGGVAVAIVSSTQKAADLEAQMGGIAAVMGKTKEEVAPLKDLILQLGIDPKLKVNATEAANAIEMLGRNGLTMSQIMDGAARNTVLLANATGADFGTAADIATDVMSLFNIEAKDMGQAVNGITSVVNNSKFSINDYKLALAQGGGVATLAGVEFDDFNTTIAAISSQFDSGSDAGTSLKTMLQRIIPQSNDAADKMRKLGLFTGLTESEFDKLNGKIDKQRQKIINLDPESKNYKDNLANLTTELQSMEAQLIKGNNAFFDQDGNLRSMSEISEELKVATKDLSDEQLNNAMSTIFGSDAVRAAAAIARLGKKDFDDLKSTMGNTSAEDAAATRVDNLKGSMEILSGIVETLQLRIGEKFIPVFRRMVDAFSGFLEGNSDRIVEFFDGMTPKLEQLGDGFIKLVGEILDFATGASDGVGTFSNAWERSSTFVINKASEMLPIFRGKMAEWGQAAWGWLFGDTTVKLSDGLQGMFNSVRQWVTDRIPDLINVMLGWATVATDWVGEALPKLIENLGQLVTDMITWIQGGGVGRISESMGTWVKAMLTWMGDEVQPRIQPEVDKLVTALNTALTNASGAISESGRLIGSALIQGMKDSIGFGTTPEWVQMLMAPFQGIITTVKSIFGIKSPSTVFFNIGLDMLQGLIDAVNGSWSAVVTHIGAFAENIWNHFGSILSGSQFFNWGKDLMNGLKDGIGSKIGEVKASIENGMNGVADRVKDFFGLNSPSKLFMEFGGNLMEGMALGITSGLDGVLSSVDLSMGAVAGNANSVVNNSTRAVDNTFNVSFAGSNRHNEADEATRLMNMLSNTVTVPT